MNPPNDKTNLNVGSAESEGGQSDRPGLGAKFLAWLKEKSSKAYAAAALAWEDASFGQKSFFVLLAISAIFLSYIGASMFHDYMLSQKYSYLSPIIKTRTGILPDGAQIQTMEEPLVDYYKSKLRRSSSKPVYFMFEMDESVNVEKMYDLVIARVEPNAYHVRIARAGELTDLKMALQKDGQLDAIQIIPLSTVDALEKRNLESIALRLGPVETRSLRNIESLIVGSINILIAAAFIFFAYIMIRQNSKALRFITPGKIKGSIDDLIGMHDIKAEVLRAKDFLENRERYKEYGVERPANILFSGPPGTGKTKLAGYLAKALDLPILFHSAANLETGYINGGAQTLEKALAMAKKKKRCVIFLDEAQDLFMRRGGGARKFDDDTQNTMLSILDGVRTASDAEIIWIVASNFNSSSMAMDEAMLRRFPLKIDFRLPNLDERRSILEFYLSKASGKCAAELSLDSLSHFTEGSSPADLEEIVREASMDCGRRKALVDEAALTRAAERMLVGNTDEGATEGRHAEREVIALHEAGHFLVEALRHCGGRLEDIAHARGKVGSIKISLKANARSGALGFVLRKPAGSMLQTKRDMEWEVKTLFGGMANEEIFFGPDGVTTGAYGDIQQATRLLSRAVRDMGMFKSGKVNFTALDANSMRADISPEDRAVMERESQRLFDEAKNMLLPCKSASRAMADALIERLEIGADDLIEIAAHVAANLQKPSLTSPDIPASSQQSNPTTVE